MFIGKKHGLVAFWGGFLAGVDYFWGILSVAFSELPQRSHWSP